MALGLVPFAGIGQQLLDAAEVLPPGTPDARRGLAIGQIVGGIFTTLGGITGGVIGAAETSTGVGAVAGVPTMAASARLVAGGVGNIAAGIQGLSQSMMSSGSGSSASHGLTTAENGKRFNGPKPKYHINEAHVPGSRNFNPRKTPLPDDAAEVFKNAVPDSPTNPRNWYGVNGEGKIYRFSGSNDGTAHFSGIEGVGDGIRNISDYALQRLGR